MKYTSVAETPFYLFLLLEKLILLKLIHFNETKYVTILLGDGEGEGTSKMETTHINKSAIIYRERRYAYRGTWHQLNEQSSVKFTAAIDVNYYKDDIFMP